MLVILYSMKYFAAQIQTSKEDYFITNVTSKLGTNATQQRFIFLRRYLPIRKAGKTTKEVKPIFPGYIFIEANEMDSSLFNAIRSTQYFLRFLPDNNHIRAIENNDLALLKHFITLGSIAEISTVTFDEHDRIVIKSGPLEGLEGLIVKVDKRKKRAKVALDFSNKQFFIDLAFEVLEETKHEQK